MKLRSSAVLIALVGLAAGCAVETEGEVVASGRPAVYGLEKSALVVGEPLRVLGANFIESGEEGQTKLVFNGVFIVQNPDGSLAAPQRVDDFVIAPISESLEDDFEMNGETWAAGTRVLRWNRFGPFAVPFGPGNKPGTFKGDVHAVNVYEDGQVEKSEPMDVVIEVGPSIIIKRLEPIVGFQDDRVVTAGCEAPALRGLGGMPYVMEVEAVGFEPAYFIYEFHNVDTCTKVDPSAPDADVKLQECKSKTSLEIQHQAAGSTDVVGDPTVNSGDPAIVFNRLKDTEGWGIVAIRVTAVDVNDQAYETALPLRLVRPMGFHYDGSRELAEYYEPVLVNGPITGGIGTKLQYSETKTETRQQGVSVNVSQTFSQSQGNMQSENWSEGVSEGTTVSTSNSVGVSHSESESSSESYGEQVNTSSQTSVGFSSSDGSNWGWNTVEGTSEEDYQAKMNEVFGSASASLSTEVGAEGSVPGFAKVSGKVGTTVGAEVGGSTGNQTAQSVSTKKEHGNSMGGSSNETESFGSVTTDGKSETFSGTFALASQHTINNNTTESQASNQSKTYSLGGNASVSEQVSEASSESWSETFVTTESQSSQLAISEAVPSGSCAKIYRQTVRWVRTAQVYTYDLCGVRSLAGETYFTEWSWSPDIAVARDCDEAVPDMPKAECFIACE